MKVRIEFVPENTTEESVLLHLANNEGAMEEVSSKLQDTLHVYLRPAFRVISGRNHWQTMKGHYYFEPWQPKVEVTYVRITEKGDTK